MDVPVEVLEELKCEKCNKYLSRSPVYVQHVDGAGLCGGCFKPELSASRNKQYESLATLFKFPCKYQQLGCTETVPFVEETQNIPHEDECTFRQFVCPVLKSNGCAWVGSKHEILQHCREQHPQQVVGNPVTFKHDDQQSSIRTYLLIAYDLLFLLHTKVCLITGKIYHLIRLLGDSTKVNSFDYSIVVKRENVLISKPGKVAPQGDLEFDEPISVDFSINGLREVMTDFKNTNFTISIKKLRTNETIQCIRCEKDITKFVYRQWNGWCCENCIPKKRDCENKPHGCTYNDFYDKCRKHETFFCPYTKYCQLCNGFIVEESLPAHYDLIHKRDTFAAGSLWRVTKTNYFGRCSLILTIAGKAVCEYRMNDAQFQLVLHIPIPSEHLIDFQCIIEVTNPVTNFSQTFMPDLSAYTDWEDWYTGFKHFDLAWTETGLNISIDIKRV